jgi:glycolate oxidase
LNQAAFFFAVSVGIILMTNGAIVEFLKGIVAPENVLTDQESLVCYSFDATRYTALPDVVVKPRTSQEVAGVVALAYEESIPVTPRGAGTGLSGGSVPVKRGIVISTERMNSPARIHKEDLYAIVEPGVVTEHFQRDVEAKGLFYPPDPASQGACTIGGNIGECAGGLRGLKYGTTKNYVLGLEIVTPEGKIVKTGARTVKSVAGYDVTRLMVGSEGTLGIVTSVILKLLPLPQARRVLACRFDNIEDAADAVAEIIESGLVPSILEIMDDKTVEAVAAHLEEDLGKGVLLLAEFDGAKPLCQEEASKATGILNARHGGVVGGEVEAEKSEMLWAARRAALPALTRLSKTVILEDVTVPRSRLADMVGKITKISEKYDLKVAVFGHAGDGNIHPTFLTDRKNGGEMKRVEAAIGEMMCACVDLGGTISGEHGIGVDKMPFLKLEIGKAGYEVMRRLKDSLDPNGIMNPGKMFYDT